VRSRWIRDDWRLHFCWWPRTIAPGDCRWLEWVERKWYDPSHYDSYWEYRELQPGTNIRERLELEGSRVHALRMMEFKARMGG
jgi:hypothetical protein